MGWMPGSGRSPGGGNGNPLQYPCPGNLMDRESGELQSMGPQRVGCDGATQHTHAHLVGPLMVLQWMETSEAETTEG